MPFFTYWFETWSPGPMNVWGYKRWRKKSRSSWNVTKILWSVSGEPVINLPFLGLWDVSLSKSVVVMLIFVSCVPKLVLSSLFMTSRTLRIEVHIWEVASDLWYLKTDRTLVRDLPRIDKNYSFTGCRLFRLLLTKFLIKNPVHWHNMSKGSFELFAVRWTLTLSSCDKGAPQGYF